MATVKVVPGSYLPLSGTQTYTYTTKTPVKAGRLVSIDLAGRVLRGVVEGPTKAPRGVPLKMADEEPFVLPSHQLKLAYDIAANYRASLAAVIKLMLPPLGKLEPDNSARQGVLANDVWTDNLLADDDARNDVLAANDPEDYVSTTERKNNKINDAIAADPAATLKDSQQKLVLNAEQKIAFKSIKKSFGTYQGFLLYGVTSSGKTEVYLKAAMDLVARGRQVVMLVPEISMSSHLAERLKKYLGNQVIIWHSGRTSQQKRLDWARLACGYPALVIGARSALFLPYPKLGLIVVDEEQDSSYKQDARAPRYHARAVAGLLGQRAGCPVVYGSATPSTEIWHMADKGKIKKLSLTRRFGGALVPTIEIIDMRGLPQKHSFSQPALDKIAETLRDQMQTIVLINRRGRVPLMQCRACGGAVRCQKCERPLVLHGGAGTNQRLACHYCDTLLPVVSTCPRCHGNDFLKLGHGTQSIADELIKLFPGSRVARLDRDTAHSNKKLKRLTDDLQAGRVDILVGTQLVAKGWDLDKLRLVVVVDADQGLLVPDFRAHERTLQLLWQVAGRAGRRQDPGTVLVQTRQPDHLALKALANNRLATFMRAELEQRKKYGFPPFRRLVKIIINGSSASVRHKKDQLLLKKLSALINQEDANRTATSKAAQRKAGNQNIPSSKNATQNISAQTTIFPPQQLTLPGGRKALQRIVATRDPQKIFPAISTDLLVDVDPEDYLA